METQMTNRQTTVTFTWEDILLSGIIEKEYENSFLVQINTPSKEIMEKFNGRMIVSKKLCETVE